MTLAGILKSIHNNWGTIHLRQKYLIQIDTDIKRFSPQKRPLIYWLLNHFEFSYFIRIDNIPYCLLPSARNHIRYQEKAGEQYRYEFFCASCEYQKRCPGWPRTLTENVKKYAEPIVDSPETVSIQVTNRCNLRCLACTVQQKPARMIAPERVKNIMSECKKMGVTTLKFTGGEPLLHTKIKSLLSWSREYGFYTILNTNGTIFNPEIAELLKKNVDNVLVSLQGYDQTSDEYLTRHPSRFRDKLLNIRAIRSLVPTLRIGTILSQTFLKDRKKYGLLIQHLEPHYWELFYPVNKTSGEYAISKNQLISVMGFIQDLRVRTGIKTKITSHIPFCITSFKMSLGVLAEAHADHGCTTLTVSPEGHYKTRYSSPIILGRTLRKAWHHPARTTAESADTIRKKCQQCEYVFWCRGGKRLSLL